MVSDMAAKGVFFRWIGQPIKAPSGSVGHPHGGRLVHYGTVEIIEAETAAELEDAVSISVDDIVEVVALDGGKENSGTLGNEAGDSSPHQPFLAQVEALWEDMFTGIPYCRARWLLRAHELLGNISRNEVLLTTAADTFEITYILGLAQIGSPAVLIAEKPRPASDCEAKSSCRVGTRKVAGKGRGKATLTLARGYDPFSEEGEFRSLPADHPALSRLRHRAREEATATAAAVADGNGEARGVGEHSQHKRRSSRRSGWRFSARGFGADGSAGAERKSLSGARLAEGGEVKARDGSSVSSSASIQHSSDSSSSDGSDGSYRQKNCASSGDSKGESKEEPRARKAVRCHHPMVRRKRQTRRSSITLDVQQRRPRRLAMPPSQASGKLVPTTRSSRIHGANLSKPRRLVEPVSAAGERSKSLLIGGQMARDIQVEGEPKGEEGSPHGAFPHRPAGVGREYQANIPALLSKEEQKTYREEVDRGEMGGVQVWASVRDWKDEDKSRLDEYLQQARSSMEERRFTPGVPAAISIGNSKDKRRKRKMAWAVMSTGGSECSKKASVKCSGNESLEVLRDAVQPFQVEEMALHAWMQEKNFVDFGPALNALHAQTDDSGPLATWTNEQIGSLLEALERDFGQDRYHRSRGQDRYRDEHTDLASLSTSVEGKTPSQVLSFYYRYMATGDPIPYLLGTSESSRKLREKRIVRPRTPPPLSSPSASPSPTLSQQQRHQQVSDSDMVAAKKKETVITSDGVKQEAGPCKRDAVPRGDSCEQLQSSLGSEREASSGGAAGAGVPKRLPQKRGAVDEGGRAMQRPRRMGGTMRPSIPADAVIVEVSDDEESLMPPRSRQTGNDNKVEDSNDGVGGRGVGDRAETGEGAVNFSEPVGGAGFAAHDAGVFTGIRHSGDDNHNHPFDSCHDPRPVDPAYMDPRYSDPGYSDLRYVDQRYPEPPYAEPQYPDPRHIDRRYPDPRHADPRYPDPRNGDPRYVDQRHVDPRHVDQRYVDHPQYSDLRYQAEPRYSDQQFADPRYGGSRDFDPVYANYRYAEQRYSDPRYHGDSRYYADQGFADGLYANDPRLAVDHVMHPADRGNPSGGVHPLENGLYPMQSAGGGRCSTGRGEVGYGRVPGVHSSERIRQGHGRSRGVDGGVELGHCWQLLEWAKNTGLEEDRVRYLEGLLQAHERRPMTYNMLVERLESALSDRPNMLQNFIRLFEQMELPDPRHPYSAARPHAPLDYNNVDKTHGVSSRPSTGRDLGFAPSPSREPYHDPGMEAYSYVDRGMERRTGHGQHDRLVAGHRSPSPTHGVPPAFDVSADIPMLGVGTSMRGSGTPATLLLPPPPPLPATHLGSMPYMTRDFSSSGAARAAGSASGIASAQHADEMRSPSKIAADMAPTVGDDASMVSRSCQRHGNRKRGLGSAAVAAPDAAAGGSKPSSVEGAIGSDSTVDVDVGKGVASDSNEAKRPRHDRVDTLRPT